MYFYLFRMVRASVTVIRCGCYNMQSGKGPITVVVKTGLYGAIYYTGFERLKCCIFFYWNVLRSILNSFVWCDAGRVPTFRGISCVRRQYRSTVSTETAGSSETSIHACQATRRLMPLWTAIFMVTAMGTQCQSILNESLPSVSLQISQVGTAFQPDSAWKRSHNLHETYQLPCLQ
jgi:hypothetical protein